MLLGMCVDVVEEGWGLGDSYVFRCGRGSGLCHSVGGGTSVGWRAHMQVFFPRYGYNSVRLWSVDPDADFS